MPFAKSLVFVFIAATFVAFPTARAGADWPVYGHDLGNSRNGGMDGPSSSTVGLLATSWKYGSGHSFDGTPIVAGGVVVVASTDGRISALDAATGKPLWSRDTHRYITSSAAIWHGKVYIPLNLWGTPNERPKLLALRLSDGSKVFEVRLDNHWGSDVYSSPVPYKGTIYIGVSAGYGEYACSCVRVRGRELALDANTGAVRWRSFTVPRGRDGGGVWSTPAIDPTRGRLYIGTGNAYHAPAAPTTDAILALDTNTGRQLGHFQPIPGDVFTHPSQGDTHPERDFGASPNLFTVHGQALVGELQKSGYYYAIDRSTMKKRWRGGVRAHPLNHPEALASTAYNRDRIFGQNSDGLEWGLSATGGSLWRKPRTGAYNYASIAVANGVVYRITAAGALEARAPANGSLLASIQLPQSQGGISIARRTVFVSTNDGVFALRVP